MRVLKRFMSSVVVFVPFASYVYAIQVAYDGVKSGDAPLEKAGLFMLALVAGSVTYDATKHCLFMPNKQFDRFFGALVETWIAILLLILFSAAAAYLLNNQNVYPFWLGAATYICTLIITAWVVASATATIESANKKQAQPG